MKKVEACHLALEFPENTRKRKTDTKKSVYNAPPGWIISSYTRVIKTDLGPTSSNINMVAANSNFISNSELNEAYKEAVDLSVNLTYKGAELVALKGKLDSSYSQFRSYKNQISASHQTLELECSIRGAGFTKGRTIFDMYLSVELTEMPDEVRNINALKANFKSIIDEFVNDNPQDNNDDTNEDNSLEYDNIQSQAVFFGNSFFAINKFEQLVRISWEGNWKTEIIAASIAVVKGSIRTSDKYKTLYTLSDDGKDILFVQYVGGKWMHGVIDTWGGKIIPSSFNALETQIGVYGLNEEGKFIITYQDGAGSLMPDGSKISFAVLNETKDLV